MSEQNTQPTEPEDYGVRDFIIGGETMTLKFTAATRFRLFQDMSPDQIQNYVTSEAFKLQSLALLILGKDAIKMPVSDILDKLDDLGMMDHELNAVYEWVLKRTINFMLSEAEAAARMISESMPKVNELSNTLTSSQA